MAEADTILVVEDDIDIRTLLTRHFQDFRIRCVTVASVDEARRVLFEERCVVAVLIDVMCPVRSDSLAFAKEVSEMGPAVVVTTGHPDCIAEIEASALCFIIKPYDAEALHLMIEGAVQRNKRRLDRFVPDSSSQASGSTGPGLSGVRWTSTFGGCERTAPVGKH